VKILLVNDNPVVNKLVTLSAQKTSDELDVASLIDEVREGSYDLLVLDNTLYSETVIDELQSKVDYKKSLYIYSKDAGEVEGFTATLKKPFLPTDLVELFSVFGKDTNTIDLANTDDVIEDDELSQDDERSDGVLDKEEVQEVQDLLDETEIESDEEELDLSSLEDELIFNDEDLDELDSVETENDLETQIEDALEELLDEELESEVDSDLLLDIAATGIDSLDALNTRDLKIAIGEEVSMEESEIQEKTSDLDELEELGDDAKIDGVDALKNLLAALSDKKVAASMKGMKISINITLGDNE